MDLSTDSDSTCRSKVGRLLQVSVPKRGLWCFKGSNIGRGAVWDLQALLALSAFVRHSGPGLTAALKAGALSRVVFMCSDKDWRVRR